MTALIVAVCALLVGPVTQSNGFGPSDQEAQQVGASGSPEALVRIDKLVQPFGVGPGFYRSVEYRPDQEGRLPTMPTRSPRYAVVNYRRPTDVGEIGSGVEVWVDLMSGSALVVPKSVIRTAQIEASKAGLDLSRYRREVSEVGDRFKVLYTVRASGSLVDGQVAVYIDKKTGKLAWPIRWGGN